MKVVRTRGEFRKVAGSACLVLIAALVASVGTAARVGAASTFRLTDLGTLGGDWSQASALNDAGQVVGSSARADGTSHAFSWTAAGGMVDLGTLGGAMSSATAVNNSGVVVGYADTADAVSHAFSWTAGGGMVDLGTLGGTFSAATAVNNSGFVVGHADVASGSSRAFLRKPGDSVMTDLGTLGGDYSSASAVNDSGQVVGSATDASGSLHATSWSGSAVVNLSPAAPYGAAVAVNGTGQVVGFAYSPDFSYSHAFSWTAAGGLSDIATLGGLNSYAFSLNDAGQVVGWANGSDNSQHPFSWTAAAGMSDLGTLGSAFAVNATGQVVGGEASAGSMHAFSTDPDDGHLVDLGTLGGAFSGAVDVNIRGKAAGFAATAAGSMHAALFSPPTLFDRVQEVLAALPSTSPRFVAASTALGGALDPAEWNTAGTALSYPNGMRFFDQLKQTIDQLDKVPNSPDAQKAIADLWTIAHQLAADAAGQARLTSADARWSVSHTDALERLKQAWRTAEAAV